MNNQLNINHHTVSAVVLDNPVHDFTPDGVPRAIFYADGEYWSGDVGKPNHYRVVAFGKMADTVVDRFVRRGSQVILSGPSRIREEPSGPVTEFVGGPRQEIKVLPEGGSL